MAANPIHIAWTGQLATGLQEVDDQHRQLLDILNRLAEQRQSALDSSAIEKLLHELKSYAGYHFRLEEDLMASWPVNARNRAVHERAHASFIDYVGRIEPLLDAGQEEMLDHLLAFLTKWLVHHIVGIDARLVRELVSLGMPLPTVETAAPPSGDDMINVVSELYEAVSANSLEVLKLRRQLEKEVLARRQVETELQTCRKMLQTRSKEA